MNNANNVRTDWEFDWTCVDLVFEDFEFKFEPIEFPEMELVFTDFVFDFSDKQ